MLNDSIHSLRQSCSYERRSLKDRLQDTLAVFQKAVKSAKSKYLSKIINDYNSPKILFSTVDSVLNPVVNV